jgi:hypothetical protein
MPHDLGFSAFFKAINPFCLFSLFSFALYLMQTFSCVSELREAFVTLLHVPGDSRLTTVTFLQLLNPNIHHLVLCLVHINGANGISLP